MFKWYFNNYFIDNNLIFWISTALIIIIIFVTIYLVRKVLKDNANKWFT